MISPLTSSPEDRAGAVLTVDLAALVENWRRLKRKAGAACDMGAVVKADAYGLGLAPVARALKDAGCATFYVAHLDEAVALRGIIGPSPRIVCMHGPTPGRTERDFAAHNVIPVLSTAEHIKAWRKFAVAADVLMESMIQIDTGMNRLGLTAREFTTHMDDPEGFLGLHPLALMSHLACADTPSHPLNRLQQERFASALATFRTKFGDAKGSLANSAGILLGPAWHYDFARPGIALYGARATIDGPAWPTVPVVRLAARILQVRRVDAAAPVGYGATVQAPDGAKLATVSMGYADGLLRAASPGGSGVLDGFKVPILGRVSMDLTTFDVSLVPESSAVPGAFIEVIGAAHTVDDLAREAGTVGYEILTALGARFHRRYLPAPPPSARTS
ncbi:MAG: alanine racemase [Rhodospirillaceae bacterium]|nr:MAG: alanine racemase [Rhodospirillaceae bacterium]